ncbi:MAG: hypothetical protein NTW33_02935 [Methanoregula sp.]|nr:hypothetical protein [Methanoregula sp.]
MKRSLVLAGILLLAIWFFANPAQAFTAKSLDISVQQNADAVITFDYELSWVENIAVFMRIADPGLELKKALESNYKKPVVVTVADGGRSQFIVQGFASPQEHNGTVTMKSPALSFVEAENVLNQYWFAPFINPDFSPETTRVSFPDGYFEEFANEISIPSISHTLNP